MPVTLTLKDLDLETLESQPEGSGIRLTLADLDQENETQYHWKGAAKRIPWDVGSALGGALPSGLGILGEATRAYSESLDQEPKKPVYQPPGFPASRPPASEGVPVSPVIPEQKLKDPERAKALWKKLRTVGEENKAFYKDKMMKDPDIHAFMESTAKGTESLWTEALGSLGPTAAGVFVAPIPVLGPVMNAAMFFDLNKEEIYDATLQRLTQEGVAQQEAETTAEKVSNAGGAVNALLDVFGADFIAGAVSKPIRRKLLQLLVGVAASSAVEGGTEGSQGVIGKVSEEWAAKPKMETKDEFAARMVEMAPELARIFAHDAAIGAMIGGGMTAGLMGPAIIMEEPGDKKTRSRKSGAPGMDKTAPMPTPETAAKDVAQESVRKQKQDEAIQNAADDAERARLAEIGRAAAAELDQAAQQPEVPGLTEADRTGMSPEQEAEAYLDDILQEQPYEEKPGEEPYVEGPGPDEGPGPVKGEEGPGPQTPGPPKGPMPEGPAPEAGGVGPGPPEVVETLDEPAATAPAEAEAGERVEETGGTPAEEKTVDHRTELESVLQNGQAATVPGQLWLMTEKLARVVKGKMSLTAEGLGRLKELRKGEKRDHAVETLTGRRLKPGEPRSGAEYLDDIEGAAETKPEKTAEHPAIVTRAIKEAMADIGQFTAEEKKDLDKAVKDGILIKGKGGPFPNLKTVYASPGYDFEGERNKALAEITGAAEAEKEPWQMTREEYEKYSAGLREEAVRADTSWRDWSVAAPREVEGRTQEEKQINFNVELQRRKRLRDETWKKAQAHGLGKHAILVANAYAEGKTIPSEVLAEYPGLTKKEPETIEEVEGAAEPEETPRRSARDEAIGVLSGGKLDQLEAAGLEVGWADEIGEVKKGSDLYYDVAGAVSGGKADQFFEAGLSVRKKETAAPADREAILEQSREILKKVIRHPDAAQMTDLPKANVNWMLKNRDYENHKAQDTKAGNLTNGHWLIKSKFVPDSVEELAGRKGKESWQPDDSSIMPQEGDLIRPLYYVGAYQQERRNYVRDNERYRYTAAFQTVNGMPVLFDGRYLAYLQETIPDFRIAFHQKKDGPASWGQGLIYSGDKLAAILMPIRDDLGITFPELPEDTVLPPPAEKSLAEAPTEDVLAAFDQAVSRVEKAETTAKALAGVAPKATRKQAKAKLKEAGKHMAAIGDLVSRMNDVLGEKGEIGPGIDEERWEQLKPLLKEAWTHAVAAGKSVAEFVDILVKAGLRASARPYLRRFLDERESIMEEPAEGTETEADLEVEAPETGELEEVEGAAEPEAGEREITEEEVEAAEPGKEKKPKKPKGGKKTAGGKKRRRKIQDVGERLGGKRSSKDHRERVEAITLELDKALPTHASADRIINALKRMTSKSALFKLEPGEGATPGTLRYLESVRKEFDNFIEYAGAKLGGGRERWKPSFTEAIKLKLEEAGAGAAIKAGILPNETEKQLREFASTYIALMERSAEVTRGATSVAQARNALFELYFKEGSQQDAIRDLSIWSFVDHLSDTGVVANKLFKKLRIMKYLMFSLPDTLIATEEEETKNLPIVRRSHRIMDIKTSGKHRRGKDVKPEKLMEIFGLRGVDFGEWAEADFRQQSVNLTFDSFYDMMDVIGAPAKGISLPSDPTPLGIGYGARGRGGKTAAAFYPADRVIGLTKTKGDGSLAHEWGHALDFMSKLNLQNNKDREVQAYVPMDDLKHALKYRYDLSHLEEEVHNLLKGIHTRSRQGRDRLEEARKFLTEDWERHFVTKTKYYQDAVQLDGGVKGAYWSEGKEMFARAFEAFVCDALKEENLYLVDATFVGPGAVEALFRRMYGAYPRQEEREYFNGLFQRFFEGMEWSEDGIPTMKPEYVPVTIQDYKKTKAAIQEMLDKLDDVYNSLYKGDPSEDGLYWYAYKATAWGPTMQPDGAMAHDDEYRHEAAEGEEPVAGQGAVAYGEPLISDDVIAFGLMPIVHQKSDATLYIGEGDGRLQGRSMVSGERALGEVSARDGQASEETGDIRAGAGRDTGEGPGRTGGHEAPGAGPRDSDGDRIEEVDIPPVGGGDADTSPGSDALQSAGRLIDYSITPTDGLGVKQSLHIRFANNLAAIRTLKQIEADERLATPEEQKILVKFTGWGGLGGALEYHPSDAWKAQNDLLVRSLTPEELEEARTNVLDAFYTPPEVYDGMYRVLERFGFMGGRVIDPSIGTGHSIGTMPVEMRNVSSVTGVELDSISARIARQLYQSIGVMHEDFAKAQLPERYYDLFITNVPFGEQQLHDKKHNPFNFPIHDHFINKGLALLRPGGMMAVITSTGTMDKRGTKARELWAEEADLIGAVRLPSTAFEASGAGAGGDILFLRKKSDDVPEVPDQAWVESKNQELPYVNRNGERHADYKYTASVNEYWSNHPEAVLGDLVMRQDWRGGRVQALGNMDDIGSRIDEAVRDYPENIYIKDQTAHELNVADRIPDPSVVKLNAIFEGEDGGIYVWDGAAALPYKFPKDDKQDKKGRVKAMIRLRGIIRQLLKASALGEKKEADKYRKQLHKAYDAFEKKYGWINADINYRLFSDDPDVGLLLALEKWDPDEKISKGKEAIFSKDYIAEITEPTSAENGADALVQSLNFKGRVDLNYMSKLTGRDRAALIRELKGRIYNDPQKGYLTADEYLSGNVRKKLQAAEAAARIDKRFEANIEALKAVLPEDLPPHKIRAGLGAPWVPVEYIRDFAIELMGGRFTRFKIEFVPELGNYQIVWTGYSKAEAKRNKDYAKNLTDATGTWGTERADFWTLLDFALNGGFPRITDPVRNADGSITRVFNQKETDAALAKLSQIKDKFESWVWQDEDRMNAMVAGYNDEMNAMVDRIYDGSHLTLPGKVPDAIVKLRPHQKNAIWRFLQSGIAYFGHEVGTGKTYSIIASVMEARRLGLAKKPIICILKSNLTDYQASFQRLYPTANVLYMEVPGDLKKRKKIFARIATGSYDAIVVTHQALERIPLSPESTARTIRKELRKLEAAMIQAQQEGASHITMREIQRAMSKLRSKMESVLDRARDDVPTMEEMGIDMLVLDEAHKFKNLLFSTRYRNVKGINVTDTGRSMDVLTKMDYIRERYGRNILMASGTPLTNSVAELYTLSRYLHPEELERRGITQFDAWANTFGRIEQDTETTPEGGGFQQVTKFKRFINIPELMQMVRKHLDLVRVGDEPAQGVVVIPRPKIAGGKPLSVTVPQNQYVEALQTQFKYRATEIRRLGLEAEWLGYRDNMLRIIGEGRKMAIDPRLYNPELWDDGDTKINYLINDLTDDYSKTYPATDLETGEDYMEDNPVFLVFLDMGVPGKKNQFNAYADIRKKLIAKGIPKEKIAFIHDATSDAERRILFKAVNDGKIRVIIGSTEKLGTGTNVQKRVAGIYHMDVHWNFANYEQRNGRGLRYGNVMKQIFIKNYGVEGTVDAFMWDKNASKGFVLGQVLSYNPQVREVEDISRDTLTATEFVAALSGDPLHKEQIDLQSRVRQLKNARAVWDDNNRRMRYRLSRAPADMESLNNQVAQHEQDLAELNKITAVKIGEEFWELKKDGGKANQAAEKIAADPKLREALKKNPESRKTVGQFGSVTEKEVTYYEDVKEKVKDSKTGKTKEVIRSVQKSKRVKEFHPIGAWLKLSFALFEDAVKYQFNLDSGLKDFGDISAGISRLVTTRTKRSEQNLEEAREDIENLKKEIPRLEEEVKKPFEHERELTEKESRLTEVTDILVQQQAAHQAAQQVRGADEMEVLRAANELLEVDSLTRRLVRPKPQKKPRGMKVKAVQDLAAELGKVFKGLSAHEIVALKSEADLGEDVRKRAAQGREEPGDFLVRGLYDVAPDTGKRTIYLFADAMNARRDVIDVFVHEAFHDGVSTGLGDQARPVFLSIYKEHSDAIDRTGAERGLDLSTDEGKAEATEEWIVDGMVRDTLPKSVWDAIVRAVREMLRKAGISLRYGYAELGLKPKYQPGDLRQVIRDAVVEGRNAERGARSGERPRRRLSLAGQKAATVDRGLLAKAQKMLAEGKSEQEIWDATGWTKEASGKWAFRIDDSGAKLTIKDIDNVPLNSEVPLGEILKHPELFDAYPDATDIPVKFIRSDEYSGSFDGSRITVSTKSKDTLNTILHEIQHWIQRKENFAKGGNNLSIVFDQASIRHWRSQIVRAIENMERALRSPKTKRTYLGEGNYESKPWYFATLIFSDNPFASMTKPAPLQRLETKQDVENKLAELQKLLSEADILRDKFADAQPTLDESFSFYKKIAGEIYAREAGAQFKGLPGTMEGIPRDQWIVKDGEGTSFSVESVLAPKRLLKEGIRIEADRIYEGLPDEIRERLEKSGLGLGRENWLDRIKRTAVNVAELRRHFEKLGRDFGHISDPLRVLESSQHRSRQKAGKVLTGILQGLKTPENKRIFELSIVMDDMIRDLDSGLLLEPEPESRPWEEDEAKREIKRTLPFGFENRIQVENYKKHLDDLAAKDERIKKALAERNAYMKRLKEDLVEADLLKPEVLEDQAYFHHQVLLFRALENMDQEYRFKERAREKDVRLHRKGWQRARKGSLLDYSTEYVESEFEVISQALHQLDVKAAMDVIQERADIFPSLKQAAKQWNHEEIYRRYKDTETPDPLLPFRQRVAININELFKMVADEEQSGSLYEAAGTGFQDVVEAMAEAHREYLDELAEWKEAGGKESGYPRPQPSIDHPKWFPFLAHLMSNPGAGRKQAAGIFKAILDRNKFIENELGKDMRTWRDIVPEGYVAWDPKPDGVWFSVNSISDQMLEQMRSGEKPIPEKVAHVFARVPSKKWVIPKEVAHTMDHFQAPPAGDVISRGLRLAQGGWKQWILLNPFRVIKYNLNNMSGDLDIAMAYAPKIITHYMPKAIKDLAAKTPSKAVAAELADAKNRDVLGSGWALQEAHDVTRYLEKEGMLNVLANKNNLAQKYWKNIKRFTVFRENLLRLAAYRYFKDQIQAGRKPGKDLVGASSRKEMEALRKSGASQNEMAAKLARELIGDYGNVSKGGQWLRSYALPFWSWMEINAPRYVRLMWNLPHEGKSPARGLAAMGVQLGWRGAMLGVKASMLYGAIMLWNRLMFPDEDDELKETQRKDLHIILGRREDGSIISLRFEGALADALEWINLQDAVKDLEDLAEGKKTWGDQVAEMAKAPGQRLILASRPDVKGAAELIMGRSLFPDPEFPRPIRDKWEHISSIFSLQKPYQWAAGKPKRGGDVTQRLFNDVLSMGFYSADPGETAYWNTRKAVIDWQKKHHKEPAAVIPTDTANALYYYKQSLRYGDLKAADKYLRKYAELGGSLQGMETSVRAASPLWGISAQDKDTFLKELSPDERESLKRAETWYDTIYKDAARGIPEMVGQLPAEQKVAFLRPPVISAAADDRAAMSEINRLKATGALGMAPPSRTVAVAGMPQKMTDEQYQEYMERSSAVAFNRLRQVVSTDQWDRLTDARRAAIIERIVKAARKRARGPIKRNIYREQKRAEG